MIHQVGTYIVFQDQASNFAIKKVETSGNAKVGKMKIPWNLIASTPFGGTLRFEKGTWARRQRIKFGFIDEDETNFAEAGQDNRDLVDDNKAQALSTEAIKELRTSSDHSNAEIIKTIAESSSTFASKTVFAQQKYIRKKQQKHLQQVTLFEPSAAMIAKVTSFWSAGRACGLRTDTLGALLCLGNVRPGARVACLDHSQGILLGAALQNAGAADHGRVFALMTDQVRDKVTKQFNLGPEMEKKLVAVPKSTVFDAQFPRYLKNISANPDGPEASKYLEALAVDHIHFPAKPEDPSVAISRRETQGVNPPKSKRAKLVQNAEVGSDNEEDKSDEEMNEGGKDAPWKDNVSYEERLDRWEQKRAEKLLEAEDLAKGFDSIIGVVGTQRLVPGETVFNVVEGLADSAVRALKSDGRIALLCAQMEPLSQLAARLQASKCFIAVKLEEFFFRDQQVLPMRTHPNMKADYRTFEGFVLSAIRITPIGGDESQL
eukprot:GDKJ01032543.1.p1 GENE.GDKJ01032543.1~~GDKJ01032543.1.p1  ORF type:complete len:489 (-),score=127.04 GDKJ01032543.1:46-1512(-)